MMFLKNATINLRNKLEIKVLEKKEVSWERKITVGEIPGDSSFTDGVILVSAGRVSVT